MTYEEFEWHILRMTYEEKLERLQPAFLAYALGLPHETVTSYLEHAVNSGLLEMDVTEDGRLEYFVPGADLTTLIPRPVWKEEVAEEENPKTPDEATDGSVHGPDPRMDRRVDTSRIPTSLRQHIEGRYHGADGALVPTGRRYAIVEGEVGLVMLRGARVAPQVDVRPVQDEVRVCERIPFVRPLGLLDRIKRTKTNKEFLDSMARG